jgi:hypothetical protein
LAVFLNSRLFFSVSETEISTGKFALLFLWSYWNTQIPSKATVSKTSIFSNNITENSEHIYFFSSRFDKHCSNETLQS